MSVSTPGLSIPDALHVISSLYPNAPRFEVGARLLAAVGMHVFPIDHTKRPVELRPDCRLRWGSGPRGQKATTDPEVIGWWAERWPDAGVGVACKPSHLLLTDIDVKNAEANGLGSWEKIADELGGGDPLYDETTHIRTRSGGIHLWFRDEEGIQGADNVLPGIDVKAAQGLYGGFLVAPPTPGYKTIGFKPPMPVPKWWHAFLQARRNLAAQESAVRQAACESTPFFNGGDADGILRWLSRSLPGSQADHLLWAACALRDAGYPQEEAETLLWSVVFAWPCSEGPWTTRHIHWTVKSAYSRPAAP